MTCFRPESLPAGRSVCVTSPVTTAREPKPLGDLVICADVVRREAERDGKKVAAHWAHMVVHGALHLAGYDHEAGQRERLRMERREIAVLKSFGIGNPYT